MAFLCAVIANASVTYNIVRIYGDLREMIMR